MDFTPRPTSSPALTWQEAKSATKEMETAIASHLDAAMIASRRQQPQGTLLQCSQTAWQWAGETTVMFTGAVDPAPVLEELRRYWSAQPGVVARMSQSQLPDHRMRLVIEREMGETYIVGPIYENTGMDIGSFSACFEIPEDLDPGQSF